MTKLYNEIKNLVTNANEVAAKTTLANTYTIETASLLWSCYKAVQIVDEFKRPEVFELLVKARQEPMVEVPERERGNVLFGVAYQAFPLEDGTVIPNGMTVKYSFNNQDYSLNKTKPEYVNNILHCYHNTKNEQIRSKFEMMVNGHEFVDPRIIGAECVFWRDTPIFRELRKAREVGTYEFNPFAGLNEEEAALLNVQRNDLQDRAFAKRIIGEVETIVNRPAAQAKELIELVMSQFGDMTNRTETGKRCQPLDAYDIEEEKHNIRVLSPEAEYRWELLAALKKAVKTNKKGNNELVKWLSTYAPTETAKKPTVEANSLKLARAIGYSEACKLYFQKKFGEDWREGLAVLLGYCPEAENAYTASAKVIKEIGKGTSISKAIKVSTYDVFVDGAEQVENEEVNMEIVESWLNSTNLAKYNKMLNKIERLFKEARELQLETRQAELMGYMHKLLKQEKMGLPVAPEMYASIRQENARISAKLEKLREQQ